jgi:hypothetical protein
MVLPEPPVKAHVANVLSLPVKTFLATMRRAYFLSYLWQASMVTTYEPKWFSFYPPL